MKIKPHLDTRNTTKEQKKSRAVRGERIPAKGSIIGLTKVLVSIKAR